MKRWRRRSRLLLGCTLVSLATALGAPAAGRAAGVVNSKHDFSSTGTGGLFGSTAQNQVCIFCHAPHGAASTQLLWNRDYTAPIFTVYGGTDSLDATIEQPRASSKACLACHDGSIAIDAFRAGGPATPELPSLGQIFYPGSPWGAGGSNIGGNYPGNPNVNDLADDHPVSFRYDAALAATDGKLVDPSVVTLLLPLPEGRLECATCHDVHNNGPAGTSYLLRVSQSGSALCRTCHVK